MSEQLGGYFGVKTGVLVVRAGGNDTFKLQDGDVILAIDGREPSSAQHAGRILRSYQRRREADAEGAARPQGAERRGHAARRCRSDDNDNDELKLTCAARAPRRFPLRASPELIAQAPLPARSASRLLCLDGAAGGLADRHSPTCRRCCVPDDLLVFNDTRVVAARLFGTKPSGGRVEIFLERAVGANRALVQLRASKPIREGLTITTRGGPVAVIAPR